MRTRIGLVVMFIVLSTTAARAQVVGQGAAGTDPWLITGPLTDAQLRATPVPVSGTITFSNTSIDITDRAARLLGVVYGSQGQQIKQTAINFNLAAELFSAGTVVALPTTLGASGGFKIECLSGCGGAASFSDNAAFTFGTTAISITGFVFDDTAPNAVTENNAAAPRMSGNRVPYSILRDASGNERGTNVDASNRLTTIAAQGIAAAGTVGWPITVGNVTAATDLWNSLDPIDSTVSIAITNYTSVAVSFVVSGIVDGTPNFEASDDSGTTWFAVRLTNMTLGTEEIEAFGGAGNKLYFGSLPGATNFRVRLNPDITTGGSVTVRIQASAGGFARQSGPTDSSVGFVVESTAVTPIGFLRIDAPTGVADGDIGIARMTGNRALVTRIEGAAANTLATLTGTSLDVNCTGGCGSPTQAATYIATATAAPAANQDFLNVFNPAASGKVLKVIKAQISQADTAAVTGGLATVMLHRTSTAGTTCTSVTVQSLDTNNAASGATAGTLCTTDPTSTWEYGTCDVSTEETAILSSRCVAYEFSNSGGQPITLREGQGVMLKQMGVAPVTVGVIRATIEFTSQ